MRTKPFWRVHKRQFVSGSQPTVHEWAFSQRASRISFAYNLIHSSFRYLATFDTLLCTVKFSCGFSLQVIVFHWNAIHCHIRNCDANLPIFASSQNRIVWRDIISTRCNTWPHVLLLTMLQSKWQGRIFFKNYYSHRFRRGHQVHSQSIHRREMCVLFAEMWIKVLPRLLRSLPRKFGKYTTVSLLT